MTTPKDQYISEIREKLGFTPTWLPNVKVDPGDIVLLDDDSPTPIADLRNQNLGVQIQIRDDDSTADIYHTSAEGVSIAFKAKGSAPLADSVLATADGGVSIDIKRKNAVVLEAIGCTTRRVDDQIALGQKILELYRDGKWEKEWAVITEVVYAQSLTLFLSSSSDSKIELKAAGEFSAGGTSLASASAGFEIAMSKNMATKIVATRGLTPFYKAYGVAGIFSKSWNRKAEAPREAKSLEELRDRYRARMNIVPIGG